MAWPERERGKRGGKGLRSNMKGRESPQVWIGSWLLLFKQRAQRNLSIGERTRCISQSDECKSPLQSHRTGHWQQAQEVTKKHHHSSISYCQQKSYDVTGGLHSSTAIPLRPCFVQKERCKSHEYSLKDSWGEREMP